ncbi:hypothetical protein D3C71_2018380 [compost metagenome]
MSIHRTEIAEELIIPYILQQFLAGEHLVRRDGQIVQQLIFLRGKAHFLPARCHAMRVMLDNEMGKYDIVARIRFFG